MKTDTFYIGDDNNSKGIVVRTASTPTRSTVRSVPNVSIKEKEENVTTKDVNEFFLNVLLFNLKNKFYFYFYFKVDEKIQFS